MGRKAIPENQKINNHPLYTTWCMIKQRCYNPKHTAYQYYGGLGVTMCEAWKNDFLAFVNGVGKRPSSKHSIDRFPDKTGNYDPDNFRWATTSEQAANRRTRNSIKKYIPKTINYAPKNRTTKGINGNGFTEATGNRNY